MKAEFIIVFTVILCDPMNGFHQAPCPWDSPGVNTGTGCHSLLQGIFLTHKSNLHLLGLLPCRRILSLLSHCGKVGCKWSSAFLWRLALSLTQMVDLWLPSAWTAPHSSQSMPG